MRSLRPLLPVLQAVMAVAVGTMHIACSMRLCTAIITYRDVLTPFLDGDPLVSMMIGRLVQLASRRLA
jgi:hypothetical protein